MNYVKKFIEANRQTGTTTALVRATRETRGYLICGQMEHKARLLKKYPDLRGHIFTITEVKDEKWLGSDQGPVFFDTDAIVQMTPPLLQMKVDHVYVAGSSSLPYPPLNLNDGYTAIGVDAVKNLREALFNLERDIDGYATKNDKQMNVKLTEDDLKDINIINDDFFEGEATKSMMGRVLLRKGIQFYKKLRNSLDLHSL